MEKHYLDNSATTRVSEGAAASAIKAMREIYGNPSSLHEMGFAAEEIRENARKQVAKALGAKKDEIFFTSCGTEADNWALICGAESGKRIGKHVITTAVEHAAVLKSAEVLKNRGFEITFLPPLPNGGLNLDSLEVALRDDTCLVSVMSVNNEVGAVTDITKVREVLKKRNSSALLHTDAVQAFLKIPMNADQDGADLISVSGHKIHAPKGIGALYIRKGVRIAPYIVGGGQEKGMRSGTESVPMIAAFGTACAEGFESFEKNSSRMEELKRKLLSALETQNGVIINGSHEAPHIVSFSMPGCPSEVTMRILEEKGVYVSAGSACSKGHRSHVLQAMGIPSAQIDSAIRVSLSEDSTEEDLDALLDGLENVRKRFRK